MSKRLQQMLNKSADIKGVNEILPSEVKPSDTPKTGVGLMAQLASAKARIQDLELALSSPAATNTIPIISIAPNPWQPRRVFDEAEIQKLAESIAEIGLIQPIIVRSVSNTDTPADNQSVSITDTQYQIVAGERRLRAHKLLGMAEIRVIVIVASDEEMATLALAENVDREDLTAYEVALAIRNAESAFPNRKSLASCLGINRTELYQFLAFFKLPDFVVKDLEMTPGLLGRNAAEDIVKVVTKYSEKAMEALRHLWPRVKTGEIDQGKIASLIEATITRGDRGRPERDIRKLYSGNEQAGSIMRDASKLQITIKAASLTPEMEAELRASVERLFPHKE